MGGVRGGVGLSSGIQQGFVPRSGQWRDAGRDKIGRYETRRSVGGTGSVAQVESSSLVPCAARGSAEAKATNLGT